MRRTTSHLIVVTALLVAVQAAVGAGTASASGPGYLTLLMGRTQWVQVNAKCLPYAGAVPLDQVAQALHDRGVNPTGTVVVDRTQEAVRSCFGNYTLMPSWADLATLRDQYGWSFVSSGMTHNNITVMTPEQQRAESCGSLPYFAAHGHDRAWGLFAYGGNRWNTTVQENVVSTCFAYGRTYKGGRNDQASMVYPWFQRTNSIDGGLCNDPGQPCYTYQLKTTKRYRSPNYLANLMNVGGDQWVIIQMYRFVIGSQLNTNKAFRWDCASSDWRQHWTSHVELYCLDDYLSAVDRIPDGVIVTDPATVAEAWGRTL
ncbi:MAG: hypothetical protein ACRDQ2_01845 [Gaiellales bacterium]